MILVALHASLSSSMIGNHRQKHARHGGCSRAGAPISVKRDAAGRHLTFPRLEAPSQRPIPSSDKEIPVLRLKVSGMTCEGCASAVRRAIGRVSQATEITVDLASGDVRIDGPVSAEAAASAVAAAGFAVETVG
jgi:copper chaperone